MKLDDLLSSYPRPITQLVHQLMALLHDLSPESSTRVYPGWRGVGFHHPDGGYFCGVFPQPSLVRLVFEHGAALPDPLGELQGSGSQTRYLELMPDVPLPEELIARFVGRALLR